MKKMAKKLTLSKETLRLLKESDLRKPAGGNKPESSVEIRGCPETLCYCKTSGRGVLAPHSLLSPTGG